MINLIGKKFHKLTVLNCAAMPNTVKQKKRYWECKCDCGNIKIVSTGNLNSGSVVSCGCSRYINKRTLSKKYGAEVLNHSFTNVYWFRLIHNAQRRNIEFNISKEYAYEQFLKQDKKCAYSVRDLVFTKNYCLRGREQTASLDRIDNTKGYIEGNIQWLHKDINRLKSNFSEVDFLDMCQEIIKFKKL
jgi:hypothetical protein